MYLRVRRQLAKLQLGDILLPKSHKEKCNNLRPAVCTSTLLRTTKSSTDIESCCVVNSPPLEPLQFLLWASMQPVFQRLLAGQDVPVLRPLQSPRALHSGSHLSAQSCFLQHVWHQQCSQTPVSSQNQDTCHKIFMWKYMSKETGDQSNNTKQTLYMLGKYK